MITKNYLQIFYDPDIPLSERLLLAAAVPLAVLGTLAGCSEEPNRPIDYPYSHPDERDVHIQDNDVQIDVPPRVLIDKDAVNTDVPPASCAQMLCSPGLLVGSPKGSKRFCMSFEEVHSKAGLSPQGPLFGASVVNVDQDKRPDIFLLRKGASNALYLNYNTGFSESALAYGLAFGGDTRAAVWGDFEQNGNLDLALVGDSGTVLYNRNSAGYHEVQSPSGIHDSNPGRTAIWLGANLLIATDNGTRSYEHTTGTDFVESTTFSGLWDSGRGSKFAVADYDGDGLPDVYLANLTGKNRLFHALGADQYESVEDKTQTTTEAQIQSMDAQWLDGGKKLYVANWDAANQYYVQNGGSSIVFTDTAAKLGVQDPGHTMLARWGDALGTGHSLLWLGRWGEVSLLYLPQVNEVGDVTGYQDVAYPMGMAATPAEDDGPIAAEWQDFDQDGQLDLLVVMAGGAIYLFHNTSRWVETCNY